MDAIALPIASVEVVRCMRCARSVEATSTDDVSTMGMVRIAHNLYYCERCAKMDGYTASTLPHQRHPAPSAMENEQPSRQLNAREQSLFIAAIADVHDHKLHLDDKTLGILLTQIPPYDTYQQPRPSSSSPLRDRSRTLKKGTFSKAQGI
ncbi:hypothetical protein FPOAC1_001940 [Fusarium poae]|uniref:hypothetical protein n=1 Tax=Fusarium poae TaxID=36050 RepID=UPI001CE8122F|nr:hypothetical protein FPOAC1_001940 [Fusarium poae]KAG8675945.1 hypothetical protein FPOAC1_001940 [Fusarium poae]